MLAPIVSPELSFDAHTRVAVSMDTGARRRGAVFPFWAHAEFTKALNIDLDPLGVVECPVASANFLPYGKRVGPDALAILLVILTDLDPQDEGSPLAFARASGNFGPVDGA